MGAIVSALGARPVAVLDPPDFVGQVVEIAAEDFSASAESRRPASNKMQGNSLLGGLGG